jgi:flagellar hook-length control protein FliK
VFKVASHTGVIHAQNKAFNAHSRPAGDTHQPASAFSLLLDDAADGTSAAPKQVSERAEAEKSGQPAADDNQRQPTQPAAASATDQQATPDGRADADINKSDKAAAVAIADDSVADDQTVTGKTDDSAPGPTIAAADAAPVASQQPLPAAVITPATLVETPDTALAPGAAMAAPVSSPDSPSQQPAPTQPTSPQPSNGAPATPPQVTPGEAADATAPGTSAANPKPVPATKGSVDKSGKTAPSLSAGSQTTVATQAVDAADASAAPAADTAVAANDQHRHAGNAAEDKKDHAAIAAAAGRIGADNPELSTAPHTEIHAGDVAQSKAPDGTQILAAQHPAEGIAAASPATPAGSAPEAGVAAVPLAGLAVEIAARAQAGRNRFEIRLDPPELGRIDVRLDIDRGGHVTSRLTVDRVETLDALWRDAGDLQKALQEAGFKTADNGMQFTLRDHSFAGRDQSFPTPATARVVVPAPELVVSDIMPTGYGRLLRPGGGIDIRV